MPSIWNVRSGSSSMVEGASFQGENVREAVRARRVPGSQSMCQSTVRIGSAESGRPPGSIGEAPSSSSGIRMAVWCQRSPRASSLTSKCAAPSSKFRGAHSQKNWGSDVPGAPPSGSPTPRMPHDRSRDPRNVPGSIDTSWSPSRIQPSQVPNWVSRV